MSMPWAFNHDRLCEVRLELLLVSRWPEFCHVASLAASCLRKEVCTPGGQVAQGNVKGFIIAEEKETQYEDS